MKEIRHILEQDFILLYNYHLELQKEERNETIAMLQRKEFAKLNWSMRYIIRSTREIELETNNIDEIADELKLISSRRKENESDFRVEGRYDESEGECYLCVTYNEYSIEPESKCESMAYHLTTSSAWKIKYQPDGKDAQSAIQLLDRLRKSRV